MTNSWFRLYAEFLNDPKVQIMSEAMQRRYIMLMCARCSNELVTLHDEEVAFQLRITMDEWRETKRLFVEKGFIDDALNLLNWEKRQFKSDSSTARVARHRARKKQDKEQNVTFDVTLQQRKSNAPDTDTDTDKEKEANASLSESATPLPPTASIVPCPIDAVLDRFAERLPMLPQVRRSLFKAGKGAEALRSRWRWVLTSKHERGERSGERLAITEADGIRWFDRYFAFVSESDFLTGASGKWTACDLGWLLTASHFEAVLSGKYHAKEEVAA